MSDFDDINMEGGIFLFIFLPICGILSVIFFFYQNFYLGLAAAITEGILWSALAVLLIPANRRHREKKEG